MDSGKIVESVSAAAEEVLAPLKVPKGMGSDEFTHRLLENLIPYRIAYLRDEPTLEEALAKVLERTSDRKPWRRSSRGILMNWSRPTR